ncbi:MAG: very short patch repair endonuclease [Desulfurivibrionaceae bacterium]|nr:MAG: very short patch repair endonuclease [Deltaproteobacteria bacterium HGW-Deltaproteobacteria-3]
MDIVSKKTRSKMMASVRSRNTKPEIMVRSLLHRLGYRFRLHRKDLPGNPDIVLSRYKKIIFVHGCFWHQHQGCSKSNRPDTRPEFWNKKLNENIERDKVIIRQLQDAGWTVHVIWECQTKKGEQRLLYVIKEIFSYNGDQGTDN